MLSDDIRYNFSISINSNELGILALDENIDQEGERFTRRRAFFMNQSQFKEMLEVVKKEKPEWLKND